GAGIPQILRDRRFIGGDETVKNAARGGRPHTLGTEQSLDRERNAFPRTRLPLYDLAFGIRCRRHGPGGPPGDEGVQRACALDRLDVRLGKLERRKGFALKRIARFCNRQVQGIGGERHHSSTLGTTKKWSSESGAFFIRSSG